MIATVEQSAVLRDGKTTVKIGDIVQIEMRSTFWQVVAISGLYEFETDADGNKVKKTPYRRYMLRQLFSAKLAFKPSQIAECAQEGWVCLPSKRKAQEIEQYFLTHPEDKLIADDLSKVVPAVSGMFCAVINILQGDVQLIESILEDKVGYHVYESEIKRALSELEKEGKITVGCAYKPEDLHNFSYRVYVRGIDGLADADGTFKFEILGIDKSDNWSGFENAGKVIKKAITNCNGAINVF